MPEDLNLRWEPQGIDHMCLVLITEVKSVCRGKCGASIDETTSLEARQ